MQKSSVGHLLFKFDPSKFWDWFVLFLVPFLLFFYLSFILFLIEIIVFR